MNKKMELFFRKLFFIITIICELALYIAISMVMVVSQMIFCNNIIITILLSTVFLVLLYAIILKEKIDYEDEFKK